MTDTYTFTARSTEDPTRAATFTLQNGHVSVDMAAPIEQIEASVESRDQEQQVTPWLSPIALSVLQRMIGHLPVGDVQAQLEGQSFTLSAWVRANGLRLVPLVLIWQSVDNPEAAQGFVDALQERKQETVRPGRFPGLLDYWFSWLAGGAFVILWLARRFRRTA